LGLELFLSNNDLASPTLDFQENLAAMTRWHPRSSLAEAREIRRVGEIEYNHEKLLSAFAWISSHPRHFALLTLARIREFWFLSNPAPIKSVLPALFTVMGWTGLFLIRKKQPEAFSFLILSIISYSFAYYFIQVSARYRYPIDWIFLLFSAVAIEALLLRLGVLRAAAPQIASVAKQYTQRT